MITKLVNLIKRLIRNSDQTAQALAGLRADLRRYAAAASRNNSETTQRLTQIDAHARRIDDMIAGLAERDLERSAVNSRLARLVEIQSRRLSQLLAVPGQAHVRGTPSDLKAEIDVPGMPEFSDLISDYIRNDAIRIKTSLESLKEKDRLNILLFSKRPEYFAANDLIESSKGHVASVTLISDEVELASFDKVYDIAIVCTHVMMEHLAEIIIRSHNLSPVIVAWTWDNHHSASRNSAFNPMSDIIIPAHGYCGDVLRTPHAALAESVPLCCSQWSRELTARLIREAGSLSRSDSLYGGFVLWGSPRDGLLVSLKEQIPDNAIRLLDSSCRLDQKSYFAQSPEERFSEWLSYKVSLAMPLTNDLSMRVFDALTAGQIPIVPDSCYDLDRVVSPALQRDLPILRFNDMSVESIKAAWEKAIQLYDKGGAEGVLRRHSFAREHHHISVRLNQIAQYLLNVSRAGCPLSVKIDYDGVGLRVSNVPVVRKISKSKTSSRKPSAVNRGA